MAIPIDIARQLLVYNPDTGIFTWKKRMREWFKSDRSYSAWNARFSGKRAGSLKTDPKNGYRCRIIRVLGYKEFEHRLAWLWMTNEPLPPQIDHENRDATDNRWCNLRASDNEANGRNRSMHKSNTSGVTGVVWDKEANKWRAKCRLKGKWRSLGRFKDIREAESAVSEFHETHGFDPSHGREKARYHKEHLSQYEQAGLTS